MEVLFLFLGGFPNKKGFQNFDIHVYIYIYTHLYITAICMCIHRIYIYVRTQARCPVIGDSISTSNPVWSTPSTPGLSSGP